MTVAALFVDPRGCYAGLPDVEIWDEKRDARTYPGPHPVVAHPPCSRWCRLAGLVEARWGHKRGEDGGCFDAALAAVRRWGGVLEHPAYSDAWAAFNLPKPPRNGSWLQTSCGGWTCHVEQGRYGHPAKKATWLYAHGVVLLELRWGFTPDQKSKALVSWCGNQVKSNETRPRVGKAVAAATPIEFRDALLKIARSKMTLISVSPSQIEAYIRCPRMWRGERVDKLPVIDKGYGYWGTVLHAVVERYLCADDQGRGQDGLPVELYPDGWEWATNRFTGQREHKVSLTECQQVKRVVEDAIESGYLKRWPGRQMEVTMKRRLAPGVESNAIIDVLLPGAVLDHKSLSNFDYCLSPVGLYEDVQLNFYAYEALSRDPSRDWIAVAHLYYCKTPNAKRLTRLVQTKLPHEHIRAWWQTFADIAERMAESRRLDHPKWFDVQGPISYAESCNKFGGCAFRSICSRSESLVRYVLRTKTLIAKGTTT